MKELMGFKKGINLGGWLSQSPHTKQHYDTFIIEDDIKRISTWELDHIRLPIDNELVELQDGSFNAQGFLYIDACIDWCKKYGLNIVLDLHKTTGYYCDDAQTGNLFNNTLLQERFIQLWIEFAKRYGAESETIAFELLNEVVEFAHIQAWNDLIKKTIPAIRKYAPKTFILFGGVRRNSVKSIATLDAPYDDRVAYTFHFYEPIVFTHQKAYWVENISDDVELEYPAPLNRYKELSKPLGETGIYVTEELGGEMGISFIERLFLEGVAIAEAAGVPLYCSEYGVIDQAPLASTLLWFMDMNTLFKKYNISRAAWTYKGKEFGITDQPIYNELIEFL